MGVKVAINDATRDLIIRDALQECRNAGDQEALLSFTRSFRYWALRLDLPDPGSVDDELAEFTEPDLRALRCAIRAGWPVLRTPTGDWRRKGAALLAEAERTPLLASLAAQGRGDLAGAGPPPEAPPELSAVEIRQQPVIKPRPRAAWA